MSTALYLYCHPSLLSYKLNNISPTIFINVIFKFHNTLIFLSHSYCNQSENQPTILILFSRLVSRLPSNSISLLVRRNSVITSCHCTCTWFNYCTPAPNLIPFSSQPKQLSL
jgi:hypothetical protein